MCRSTKEGFKIPKRVIPDDLKSMIKANASGDLSYKKEPIKKHSEINSLFHKASNQEALFAKGNFKGCEDSNLYHSCNIATPSLKMIDMRYLHLPPKDLDPSNMYNKLGIWCQAYQGNMDILNNKKSMGQYSGYTDNAYIDKIRYVKSDKPIPINPDFFMKGGGTFA